MEMYTYWFTAIGDDSALALLLGVMTIFANLAVIGALKVINFSVSGCLSISKG